MNMRQQLINAGLTPNSCPKFDGHVKRLSVCPKVIRITSRRRRIPEMVEIKHFTTIKGTLNAVTISGDLYQVTPEGNNVWVEAQ